MIQFLVDAQCNILEPSPCKGGCGTFRWHQRFASSPTFLEMAPYQSDPKLLASSVTPVQGDSIPLFRPPAIQFMREVLFLADKRGDCLRGATP
jgi:hypothetical protein